jgi:hypothetical protein
MMPGFRSGSFRHIIAYHRRAQYTAAGMPRGRFEAGHRAYVIGSSPLFMVARAGQRMVGISLSSSAFCRWRICLDGYMRGLPQPAASELARWIRREHRRPLSDDRTHVA